MHKQSRHSNFRRSGAVLVEFALVLPIILLTFGSIIELSRVLLLQHTADTAAYEGARGGMVPGATSAEAASASRALLNAAGLRSTTVVVSPSTITDETSLITVQVSIPVSDNFWISPMFFKNYIVRSDVTLFCERPPVVKLVGVPEMKLKIPSGKNNTPGT